MLRNAKPITLILLAACEPVDTDIAQTESGIVGGAATTIAVHPWQISLSDGSGHFCGGSVIGASWILTAAHCMEGTAASSLTVTAGITKLSQAASGQKRGVDKIVVYPGYTSSEYGKDVALLHMKSPLDLSTANVKAVAYAKPTDAALIAPGKLAVASGWGTTAFDTDNFPDNLMKVTVAITDLAAASKAYGMTLTSDQLPAGSPGKDSCQGDSGGPLTVADAAGTGRLLAGVVSWGEGCAAPGYPGLYARVSSFSTWIAQTTGAVVVTPPPSTQTCATTTARATGLPKTIPDASTTGVRTTVKVTDAGNVSSLNLSLDIRHTYRGDLVVTLIAPNGKRGVVTNRAGADAQNYILTAAAQKAFAGVPAAGTWTLLVQDLEAEDVGTLRSWSIDVKSCR